MKNYLIFLLIIQGSALSSAYCQIKDDFSDGDFSNSPAWVGDVTNFVVNGDGQLQLSAPAEASQSYLSTSNNILFNAEWSFYAKLDFNPSSSNYLDVYLVSDNADLSASLNGYFVRIGNTADEVSLYRQDGPKSSAVKIIDGLDKRFDISVVELNVKVTKNDLSEWELLVDPDRSGTFISEGTVIDGEHIFSSYFGLFCKYTSTRSTRFYFDNLAISGESSNDHDPPQLDSLVVKSDSVVWAYFNEPLAENTVGLENFFVNNGIGDPEHQKFIDDHTVSLTFSNAFPDKEINQISIHGVEDLFGNALNNFVAEFVYFAPYILQFGDMLVTEIMADPTPEVDLPEYEYLELLNATPEYLTVTGMSLVVGSDSVPVPDFHINAGEYLILCESGAVEQYRNFGVTLKVPNWPTLNNQGEQISLYNSEHELVFTVDYDDSWYQSIEKEDGGWSLEMIDTDFPCKGRENWRASIDPSGGTPGKANASADELTDLKGPEILKIVATSDQQVLVALDERIPPTDIELGQISANPNLTVSSSNLMYPDLDKIDIRFSDPMYADTEYTLKIRGLHDCAGNTSLETSATFVLPSRADSLDVIINEILFNPWTDGVDFVELYNQSEKYIDLKSWKLGNSDTLTITEINHILEPGTFLALTEAFNVLDNHYPGIDQNTILEVERLTPFNDDEGDVRLMDGLGKTIDFFHYSEDYHSPFIRDVEGVSLERISFDAASNDPDNWQSASETSGFATPGKMNSQHFPVSVRNEEVVVEPQVFDPGSAGIDNFTMIRCRFDQPGNMASIRVLDAAGRQVKTIADHQSIGTEEDFKWEGENDNGEEVRMGYYIVFMEVYNASGSVKIYRKKVVVGGRM